MDSRRIERQLGGWVDCGEEDRDGVGSSTLTRDELNVPVVAKRASCQGASTASGGGRRSNEARRIVASAVDRRTRRVVCVCIRPVTVILRTPSSDSVVSEGSEERPLDSLLQIPYRLIPYRLSRWVILNLRCSVRPHSRLAGCFQIILIRCDTTETTEKCCGIMWDERPSYHPLVCTYILRRAVPGCQQTTSGIDRYQ